MGRKRKHDYTDTDVEHAAVYGITVGVMRDRMRNGYEKGEAMTKPNNGVPGRKIKSTWFIKDMVVPEELVKQAKSNGLDSRHVRWRVNYGYSLEAAVSEPLKRKNLTKEEMKIILSNGINPSTYHTRINKGWSKERAMTEPTNEKKRNKKAEEQEELLMVSSANQTKKFKHKAEVKVPHFKKPIVIGYFETLKEAAIAEKNAMETLNQ